MSRIAYLGRSVANAFVPARFQCPNCGSGSNSVIDRKYVITQLRRCSQCQLLFRTPTDDPKLNETFYESEYTQGFTTDIPTDVELDKLKETAFAGHEKDFSGYVAILQKLGLKPGAKLFDFGCSWGYGSYQFSQAGYDVTSFEVAPTRRRYAKEKLGVMVVDNMDDAVGALAGQFDCFFSSHVIEHVPSPAQSFAYAFRLLKSDGLFVSFTPNGNRDSKDAAVNWSKLWGEVHPNLIDDVFLNKSFVESPRCINSSPIKEAHLPETAEMERLGQLGGDELFFAARRPGERWG